MVRAHAGQIYNKNIMGILVLSPAPNRINSGLSDNIWILTSITQLLTAIPNI